MVHGADFFAYPHIVYYLLVVVIRKAAETMLSIFQFLRSAFAIKYCNYRTRTRKKERNGDFAHLFVSCF